jgi:hypothetical protein|tara:strand:+ start:342 stop:554 length:213 start_codon:yes stop_codon:yes gene_type:complete
MPAHNVNTAALDMVVEGARRFEQIATALDISTMLLGDGIQLSTAITMVEEALDVADRDGTSIVLEDGRKH